MGTASSRQRPGVDAQLRARPHRFEFFQAVRILERSYRQRALTDSRWHRGPVGHDDSPQREAVRFRAAPSLTFPSGQLAHLEQERPPEVTDETRLPPPELTVSFIGLTGPSGALPDHYSTLLLQRRRLKDRGMSDFFDLINHRATSLFYRAWEKYRLPVQYERATAQPGKDDLPTWSLFALTGMATGGLRRRQKIHDEAFLAYAGHFSRRTRSAVNLELLLADCFELPVRVLQFQGEWITLRLFERTALPAPDEPSGRYNVLGREVVLGSRVWDVESRFRLRVGPLTYQQFRRFMPTGDLLQPFSELARSFVGSQFVFDVQPVLLPNEAPPCYLVADTEDPPLLGWNTWLRVNDIDREFDGVSFSLEKD